MTLAHQLATGEKTSYDVIDDGYTKHAFKDRDGLPDWFLDDESKHDKPHKPITKAAAQAIKEKLRAYNARPIKKVAEAKARKKFKQAQRLEKLKKKADMLAGDDGMSEKEKAASISKLMASVAKKTRRAPIKVVKAAGSNRGLQGRPKGGSYFFTPFSYALRMILTWSYYYSQGKIQDGGSSYEEGVEGDEEDFQEEEIDDESMLASRKSIVVGGRFNCDTFLRVHIAVEGNGCCERTGFWAVHRERDCMGWSIKIAALLNSINILVFLTLGRADPLPSFTLQTVLPATAIEKSPARMVAISFEIRT